ncbi:MAG: adenosylcobinamide-GDP ribazoletransferase [Alcanivorax sp.]|nr:adenosylcobinamide-GDP ribazoletransferase [Alcanivorax sp.]MAY10966.1 adenosylcobinamide-GDP ribazoletransferase [Alcanivorax sp.]MBI56222.1 adenosylcobinamide-GDP ribazoletransferase [Alcanivorax sp.]HCE41901.1 adenosylcobinamide-GDP ribazoletransferase [Alcanivorax sp.]|tara:strand:+ start:12399 stop:13127 length:729 start_codon:yes stop_codon:yes gene_type:complete
MNREPVRLALSLLTRLPVRVATPVDERDQGRSVAWYPAVGLLIGLLLWGLAALLASAPAWPVAVLVLAVWVGLTGALHLDGLADSADAWLGGYGDRVRTLAIMKDPYCGPAGVVAVVLVLLAKAAALAVLIPVAPLALLAAPLLARAACAGLFLALPYVREQGLGSGAARRPARRAVSGAILAAVVLVVLLGQGPAVLVAGAVFAGGAALMRRRLGGFTGDTAGALVETVEAVVLLVAALMV